MDIQAARDALAAGQEPTLQLLGADGKPNRRVARIHQYDNQFNPRTARLLVPMAAHRDQPRRGVEDVFTGAWGTTINGGTMIVEESAETGFPGIMQGIKFTGHNGVLELAGTTLTAATISGFAPTDRIDLLKFGFTVSDAPRP